MTANGPFEIWPIIASAAAVVRPLLILSLSLIAGAALSSAAGFPEAEISNGQLTAKMYLPDAKNGYYRSTRFDWSGAIYSLQYKGHEYYGPWYDRIDPKVINWVFEGQDIVSGPCGGLPGPVNEFQTVLGWDESEPGGTFIKLGVGVLRRGEGDYNRFAPYEVLDSGEWSIKKESDSIEFTQQLSDPASGYAYVYRKLVLLVEGKPEMVIEHSLTNTGRRTIKSDVYNHNFIVLDHQPPGPDFTIRFPFEIETQRPSNKELIEVRGKELVYRRPLAGHDEAIVMIGGYGDSASDTEMIIENRKAGAGIRITGDRPLIRDLLWSIRTVLAIEPYIAIDIEPGGEFTWKNMFEYYTLPASQ